jgi:hypothetical protein
MPRLDRGMRSRCQAKRGTEVSPRRVAATALIAAGIVAIAAGMATAKLQTRSKGTRIAGDGNGAAAAKCPRGSEAVSGGFAAPRFDPTFSGRSILPFSSKRAGNRKWKTKGYNFSPAQSGRLISFAYCETRQPRLSFRSTTVRLSKLHPGSATATCPSRSEAVSGGFASPDASTGGDAVLAVASKRVSQRKWKVFAYNNDDTTSQMLVAYAYCDPHQPGLKAKSKRVKVPLAQKRSVTAKCRDGSKVVSGGFAARVNASADGPFPFASKKVGRTKWRAAAVGNGAGRHPFKVFAYCKS